jgi:Domain of unknown function (DUF5606)
MEFKDIAALSGKSGLFKVVSPTRSGVILESLDEAKTKLVVSSSQKVSVLSEISIFTSTKEGNTPLLDVLKETKKKFGTEIGVNPESDPKDLKAFLKSVLPEYDEAKVYVSDMKKLVRWYTILMKHAPQIFDEESKVPDAEGTKPDESKKEDKKADNKKSKREYKK